LKVFDLLSGSGGLSVEILIKDVDEIILKMLGLIEFELKF
jgi:hypothetical protein